MTEQNHKSADEVKKDDGRGSNMLSSGNPKQLQGKKTKDEQMPVSVDNQLPANPKPTDPINEQIPCECGSKDHKAGLIIKKWGTLDDGDIEDKVKVQIFDGDEITTVVISKKKLLEKLK